MANIKKMSWRAPPPLDKSIGVWGLPAPSRVTEVASQGARVTLRNKKNLRRLANHALGAPKTSLVTFLVIRK